MSEDDPNLAIRNSVKFPCTARAQLAQDYRDRLKLEWNNKNRCDLLEKQTRGVESIKRHIAQIKREFLCHQNERFKTKFRKQQELEKNILTKYKMCLNNENLKKKIADKLIRYNSAQNTKMKKQEERMKQIVQKISTDYEWKEKSKMKKEKIFKPIQKKSTQPIFLPEESAEIFDEMEEEDWEEFQEKENIEEEEKMDKEEKSKNKAKTKEKATKESKKKEDKKKPDKKDKSKPDKKDKSKPDKKDKASKKEKQGFIMPEVPILNPREKINYEDIPKMENLISPLKEYDKFIEDEIKFYKKPEPIAKNKQFGSIPPAILFENFENGKEYKRKIYIQNRSPEIYHCKFHDIISDDDLKSVCLSIEEVGIQKVLPGCSFSLGIKFSPIEMKKLTGSLIFRTRKPGKPEISEFSIPFRCKLPSIDINVFPQNIVFKSLPFWETKNYADINYKTIEVRNNMIYDCILVIKKSSTNPDEIYEDDFENEMKNSLPHNTENSENSFTTVEILLSDCLDQLSNKFYFDSYFYNLPPKSIEKIKVFWKNSPFVGAHHEKFDFEFLQRDKGDYIELQKEMILIQAETTGKFIETNTECIDYNICVLNCVYQQSFKVYNYGTTPVKLGFQYPSKLKDYFTATPASFYVKPNNYENICLRFIPRKEIFSLYEMKYFDPYTNILNCSIKICILSSKPTNVPPTILTVYAILSEPDNIKLRFTSFDNVFEEDGCPVLHLGQVTTHETVTANFEIENLSPVVQEYAFLNLPEIISIMPDYGFGKLDPNEIKILKIGINPTCFDLITNECKHSCGPLEISRKITCTTVYKLAALPKKKTEPKHQKTYENLESKFNQEYSDINGIYSTEIFDSTEKNSPHPVSQNTEFRDEIDVEFWTEKDEQIYEEEMQQMKQLSFIIKATLFDFWTELSHQYIIFPDTSLGSHTTMDILFSAINNTTCDECICGFVNKNKMADFDCHFEVAGGSKDIIIEPICGDLKKGQSVHLLLTAKPTVESQILNQTATIYKLQRLASEKTSKKGGKKPKPDKKSTHSDKNEAENISLHNCDYYPAEKEVARYLRPYEIEAKFYFVVSFPEYLCKADEILYLGAKCKVIPPEFITNLPTQLINFGPRVIETRPKIIFELENFSRGVIEPKISPLNPSGPFICTNQIQNKLEKELILKIPVTFAPTEEKYYKEFFEIKSGNTIETLTVSGEGVKLDLEFAPKFSVCRIQAKIGKSADCIFGVNNKCKAPLNLYIHKVCDLFGKIQPKPIPKEENTEKLIKGKNKKSDKGSKKSDKKQKVKKFSEDLTIDEEYSLENFFQPFQGESKFKIMNAIDDCVSIQPETKSKIKIRFETYKPPVVKIPGEKTKGKTKDKDSKKSEKSTVEKDEKGIIYIAKFNIMLEKIVLLKDFIVIAEFN